MNAQESLHYKAIHFPILKKPIWLLIDFDGQRWVDVHSAISALGMSLYRWKPFIKMGSKAYQFSECLDRSGRETLLIDEPSFCRWLGDYKDVMKAYPVYVSVRAAAVRNGWRARIQNLLDSEIAPETETVAADKRKRKINAETVIRLHQQIRGNGISLSRAAKALNISITTAKAISSGSYKSWGPDAKQAWFQTFGAT